MKSESRTGSSVTRTKTVAILHKSQNDITGSWEYYASGAERECRLVPDQTNLTFGSNEASFYLYDHLGNTRVAYTPTSTTNLNETQVLNNTFTGSTDGWSAISNATLSSVNNQLEILTNNTSASASNVLPFNPNTEYSISVDVNIEAVGIPADEPTVSLTIISGGNSVAQMTLVNGNNTLSFTSSSQAPTVAFLQINGTLTNYRVQLDNFILSELDEVTTHSNIINSVVDYFPYGKVLREFVNGDQERYLTTQHERDQETGLDYRGARYYDSDVGRFLSIDPWQAKYPAWSTYNYCFGNPVMFIDPTGKGPEGVEGDPVKNAKRFRKKVQKLKEKYSEELQGMDQFEAYDYLKELHPNKFKRWENKYGEKSASTGWETSSYGTPIDKETVARYANIDNTLGTHSQNANLGVSEGELKIKYNMFKTPNRLRVINTTTGVTLFDTNNLAEANAVGEVAKKEGSGAVIPFDSNGANTSIQVVVGDGVTPGDIYLTYKVFLYINNNSNGGVKNATPK